MEKPGITDDLDHSGTSLDEAPQLTAQVVTTATDLSSLAPNTVYLLPRGTEIVNTQQSLPMTELIEISKLQGSASAPMQMPVSFPVEAGVVALQHEFARWQAAKQRLQLTEDHQLASVLLDLYEESIAAAQDSIDSEAAAKLLTEMERPVEPVHVAADQADTSLAVPKTEPDSGPAISKIQYVSVVRGGRARPAGAGRSRGTAADSAGSGREARRPGRRGRPRRKRPLTPTGRPCPKSKKSWYRVPGMDTDDSDEGQDVRRLSDDSEDSAPAKFYSYPAVEPELLSYFSCGLCDQTSFSSVEEHFEHLWNTHTEFHMVGGRIRRIPIRLRPQLFVMCALCGMNNRGSAGDSVTYLTTAHLPLHAPLLARAAAAPLQCDQCTEEFDDRALLALHVIDTEHRNDAVKCSSCELEIEGQRNYLAHLQRHYLSRVFQCYFCMALFGEEAQCAAHIKYHHVDDISVHKCSHCSYATALFHDFLLHIRGHSQLNRHVCHVCGIMFVSKMSLKHHLPTHTASQFPCDKCTRVFSHPQTLRRHVLSQHVNSPDKCTCRVCGRTFGTAFSMRRHHMIHTGERPHQCDKCGRGFVQKGDLLAHRRKCNAAEIAAGFMDGGVKGDQWVPSERALDAPPNSNQQNSGSGLTLMQT